MGHSDHHALTDCSARARASVPAVRDAHAAAQPLLLRQADGRAGLRRRAAVRRRQVPPPSRAAARQRRRLRARGRRARERRRAATATSSSSRAPRSIAAATRSSCSTRKPIDLHGVRGGRRDCSTQPRRQRPRAAVVRALPRVPDRRSAGALRRVRLRRHALRAEPHPRDLRVRRAGRSRACRRRCHRTRPSSSGSATLALAGAKAIVVHRRSSRLYVAADQSPTGGMIQQYDLATLRAARARSPTRVLGIARRASTARGCTPRSPARPPPTRRSCIASTRRQREPRSPPAPPARSTSPAAMARKACAC